MVVAGRREKTRSSGRSSRVPGQHTDTGGSAAGIKTKAKPSEEMVALQMAESQALATDAGDCWPAPAAQDTHWRSPPSTTQTFVERRDREAEILREHRAASSKKGAHKETYVLLLEWSYSGAAGRDGPERHKVATISSPLGGYCIAAATTTATKSTRRLVARYLQLRKEQWKRQEQQVIADETMVVASGVWWGSSQ